MSKASGRRPGKRLGRPGRAASPAPAPAPTSAIDMAGHDLVRAMYVCQAIDDALLGVPGAIALAALEVQWRRRGGRAGGPARSTLGAAAI